MPPVPPLLPLCLFVWMRPCDRGSACSVMPKMFPRISVVYRDEGILPPEREMSFVTPSWPPYSVWEVTVSMWAGRKRPSKEFRDNAKWGRGDLITLGRENEKHSDPIEWQRVRKQERELRGEGHTKWNKVIQVKRRRKGGGRENRGGPTLEMFCSSSRVLRLPVW